MRPDGVSGASSKIDVIRARAEQAPYSIVSFGSNPSFAFAVNGELPGLVE
jgi:hypothetical protein